MAQKSSLKKKATALICAGTLAFSTAACTSTGEPDQELLGAVIGGLAGAAIGAQFGKGQGRDVAIIAGAIGGMMLGGHIGRRLNDADRAMAYKTQQRALERAPTGESLDWENPDSGHSGSVKPLRTYKSAQGENCREFEQTIDVGDDSDSAVGVACRNQDGTWRVVEG